MIRAFVILVLSIPITAIGQPVSPGEVVSAYLEDARAGDWEAAASYWLPGDVERSTQLGTTYCDIPFKLDCSSYLMIPGVGDSEDIILADPVGDQDVGPVRISVIFQSQLGSYPSEYVLVREQDRWLLASMATALGRDWPVTESRYLRFRVQPGQTLNPGAADYLDQFVEDCSARLGLNDKQVAHLSEAKIDYLLCEEDVVEAIAGAPTKGVSMLPTDAVVTSEPAHTHELVHVLVGYAAQDLGLYVQPFLQEGIAVHMGGRWGKSAAVLEELGRYVLDSGLVEVEAMLPWNDFRRILPDLSYAPAGILAGFLLESLGPEGFQELYRNLSGWSGELAGQDTYEIQAEIMPSLGIAKGTLGEAVMAYSKSLRGGGIEPGSDGEEGTRVEIEDGGLKAVITTTEAWVTFDILSEKGEPAGALMLAGKEGRPGNLFEDHFPDREYRGERGAVLFNSGEAGYYDFTIDVLTAKYVHDFRPDPAYLSPEGDRVVFRIRRDLLPVEISEWGIEPSP